VSVGSGSPEAFYLPTAADSYRATLAAQGPWDPAFQHGGPPTALLAAAIERHAGPDDLRIARMTAEFLRPVPLAEVSVRVATVRPGRRVQLVEAELVHDGVVVMSARAWRHTTSAGQAPVPTKSTPPPPVPPADPAALPRVWDSFGYGRALEWRPTAGDPGGGGPAAVWARMRVPLVAGWEVTGLDRLLVLADSTNGVSLELPLTGWLSMPTALTVTVLRPPAGDWVHLAARTHLSTDGIGLSHGVLSDPDGLVAMATQPLYVAPVG
jgi:acyl-CoA thioesterase